MSVKNRTDLVAETVAQITSNGNGNITGPVLQEILNDFADSLVNMLGDTSIQGKLGYAALFSIINDGDIVYKKWVIDQILGTPDNPLTQLSWVTEDNRIVIMTIDGNNGIKITDV